MDEHAAELLAAFRAVNVVVNLGNFLVLYYIFVKIQKVIETTSVE
jgi:hypothetical protein